VQFASRVERFFTTARTALSEHLAPFGQHVEGYLSGVRSELVHAQGEIAAYNKQHTNGFNVFAYIRPNENGLSDILADLLDPRGRHGQGDAFLRLLAGQLEVPLPAGPRRATVYREEMTTYISKPRRRIDIVLDFGTFGIGIENKPWAGEQPHQVEDYFSHLGGRYPEGFLLIYLSGDGQPPPSVGIEELIRREKQNEFRLLAYRTEFVDWIRSCIALCQAESFRWFLRDFLSYVLEQFDPPGNDWKGEKR
jgi:hypothetical protein